MDHHSSIVKEQYVVLDSGIRGSDDELDQEELAHLKGYRSLLPGDASKSFLLYSSLADLFILHYIAHGNRQPLKNVPDPLLW